MASTYKVSYFDITALGEPIRYMLSYADFNFKDNRVDIRDWPSIKLGFAEYYYEQDDNLKEKKAKVLFGKTVPFYLERLEKQAQNNSGYLAVPYLSWADIVFTSLLEYINFMAGIDITQNCDNLQAIQKRVVNILNIKKWLERRPKNMPLNPKYFEHATK